MTSTAFPEEVFLKPLTKPKPPALSNSDDWPIFSIRKVKVVSQDSGELVSLLSAQKGHPVKVTGQLAEIDEEIQDRVRNQNYKKQWIELTNVVLYAFAEYSDGSFGFWAAGKAGWFEFDSVAPSYRSIHNRMGEATSWIYVLADRIKMSRFKNPIATEGPRLEKYMESIFSDYLSKAGNPARFADVGDVRDAFHEHRQFLITSMLEGQDGVDWLHTPIFAYFKVHFPEEVATATARIVPALGVNKAPEPKAEAMPESKKSGSESSDVKAFRSKRRKGRSSKESNSLQPKTPPPVSPSQDPIPGEDEDESVVVTRKRKSFLRPSGAKSAKKARTAPSNFRGSTTLDEDDESDEDKVEDSRSVARASTITTIRNGEHLNLITNPHMRSNDHESREQSAPQFLPLKYLELNVAEYDIPSTKPQGPGGLWTCSFEDCRARVHKAGIDSGQEKVKEHLKTHIVKEKIDLVREESKPYLPVNHLMRRLQAFAPPSGEELAPDSIERTFSAPIWRRY